MCLVINAVYPSRCITFWLLVFFAYEIEITSACNIKLSLPNHILKSLHESCKFYSSLLKAVCILKFTTLSNNTCSFHSFAVIFMQHEKFKNYASKKIRTQKFLGEMFIQVKNGLGVNNQCKGKSKSCQQMTYAS